MGRPRHEPTPMSRRNVEALAGYGVPEADIAGVIGIDPMEALVVPRVIAMLVMTPILSQETTVRQSRQRAHGPGLHRLTL